MPKPSIIINLLITQNSPTFTIFIKMRLSCNGCRVLRKGCSNDCSIKPCLQWIKNPDSQGHATLFLAKFYGRAGLINLITSGPDHLRPAIFRSLLYEACGRIVNPIYGSVGLLWSGNWQLCQDAVEAVLKGSPITQIASETAETNDGPPLKAYDIRHVPKDTNNSSGSNQLRRVRNPCRFKKSAGKPKTCISGRVEMNPVREEFNRSPSPESSSLSHLSDVAAVEMGDQGGAEFENGLSGSDGEIELELTLGLEPRSNRRLNKINKTNELSNVEDGGLCKMELGIIYQTPQM